MAQVTFPASLGGDGNTYSDDSDPNTGMGNGGHRVRFVPALGQSLAMAQHAKIKAEEAATSAASASTSESNAAQSAASASNSATSASNSATSASNSAASASTSESNAAQSAASASNSAASASNSAASASTSESNAAQSAASASTSATSASNSAASASTSESNAAQSAASASTSESNAAQSDASASTSAASASTSESNAEDWAVSQTLVDGVNYGAKKYALDAASSAGSIDTATLLDRANHTGTQTLSTISDAGTAAGADVTTSATDTTAGRLMKVGDFGNGKSIEVNPVSLSEITTPGDYWITTNSPADKPVERFCHLYVRSDHSYTSIHQIAQSRDTVGESWHRVSDDGGLTWTAWERIHTTANQIELGTTPDSARTAINAIAPGDYGLGGRTKSSDNDTLLETNLSYGSGPDGSNGHTLTQARTDDYISQLWTKAISGDTYTRVKYDGIWKDWKRLLFQGDSGLGDNVAPIIDDANNFFPSGYYAMQASGLNKPVVEGGNLYVNSRLADDFASQIFHPLNENTLWTRNYVGYLGGWQPWSRTYTQSNILGTVSQSSGVPTGAIIERGSNANGRYTKYADGTLTCDNSNSPITTNPATFIGSVTSIDGDKLRWGRWV